MSCHGQLFFVQRHKADNKSKHYFPITSNRMTDYTFHLLRHESIVLTLNIMYFIIKTRICIQKANESLKQEATADSWLEENRDVPNNPWLFGLNINMIDVEYVRNGCSRKFKKVNYLYNYYSNKMH
jgi:hypothetical protein